MSAIIQANNHSLPVDQLHQSLRAWDAQYRRSFPWRVTNNPFPILMAELMLRRTQARQVVSVYNEFIVKYPDAYALAIAPAEQVAQSLFSLGLAWRVPAFQQIARALVERYKCISARKIDAVPC